MRADKFKLVNGGLKGSIIEYSKQETIKDRSYENSNKKRNWAPVPAEIKSTLRKMKFDFFHVLGYWRKEYDAFFDMKNFVIDNEAGKADKLNHAYLSLVDMYSRTEILSVTNVGGIVIEARMRVFDENKTVTLKTPVIDAEDDYEHFSALDSKTIDLFDMVADYAEGQLFADGTQFAIDLFRSEGMPTEEINRLISEMDDAEKEEMMTTELQKMGSIVISSNDIMGSEPEEKAELPPKEEKPKKAAKAPLKAVKKDEVVIPKKPEVVEA